MMTRMMTRSLMMMTRSCQRREKGPRAQFSGTRKQFSPPLILINTFLKMFTSTIQHCHPVFTDRCSLLEVTIEKQTTTTVPQSSSIPSPSDCISTTLRFKTAEETLLKSNYSKVFFWALKKREFRRGGDLTWERHRHQVGKTSIECYGWKISSPASMRELDCLNLA